MHKLTWQDIQKLELQYHHRKNRDHMLDFKSRYWISLLEKIYPHVSISENTRILEVGCGPCGVVMAIDKGNLVGLDPLMDEYLAHFDFLRDAKPNWVTGTAEEMDFREPFDIVISINSLDHMYDPNQAARKMNECLIPGGHLILSLNCHNWYFFYKYYRRFYRCIDRYHPHHFRAKDVLDLYRDYRVIKVEDIDHLFLGEAEQYREKVLQSKGVDWNKFLNYLFNPLKYPVAIARILDKLQSYRKKTDQRAIFSTYLFIFQKPH